MIWDEEIKIDFLFWDRDRYLSSIGESNLKDRFDRWKNLSGFSTIKDENIGFDEYIGTWILRIYRWIFLHEYRYI